MVWDVDLAGAEYEEWRLWHHHGDGSEVSLVLDALPQGTTELPSFMTGDGRGIVQPLRPDTDWPAVAIVRAVSYCLPTLFGGEFVVRPDADGAWSAWPARHTLEAAGLEVTLEAREGLDRVLLEAKRERLFVGTRIVQVRPSDGGLIDGRVAREVLTGLTFGLSFALGRWVGLVHAQGFSAGGHPRWTQWGAPHLETPGRGSTRWWNEHRTDDLIHFLQNWLRRWLEAEDQQPLSFLVTSALAAGEGAFVEQRLLTVMAALDHYWWAFSERHDLRMGDKLHATDGDAARKLRALLETTGVPATLDAGSELVGYAREHHLADAPNALTYIRNRLTHPKVTEHLYDRQGLVAEASRLARRYLDLVLLWELGYMGHACDGTVLNRWAGESDLVPWAKSDT